MDLRLRRPPDWSVANAVTLVNLWFGSAAIALAPSAPRLAIRLVLLAAVADGLDGLLARRYGSTEIGPQLDSLADIVSFGVAPATVVLGLATEPWSIAIERPVAMALAAVVAGAFVASAAVRLSIYTVKDVDQRATRGVPTTLAATILGAAMLGVPLGPAATVGLLAVLSILMLTAIRYPDLIDRDSAIVAVLLTGSALAPTLAWRIAPRVLLAIALVYLVAAPHVYDAWNRPA